MRTVVRWNPLSDIAAIQREFDRYFGDFVKNVPASNGNIKFPLDVYETDANYTVRAILPGAQADNIQITWHDGILTIGAEVAKPEVAEDVRPLLNENFYGTFRRSLSLPVAIDADQVEASYADGVLTLSLPKVPEAQPRYIPVKPSLN